VVFILVRSFRRKGGGSIPVEYLTHLSGFNDSYLAELHSIQVVGEFLSAPAITVADAATLGYLDDDVASYCYESVCPSVSVQCTTLGYLDDDVASYCDESVCLSVCLSPVRHPWLLGRRRRHLLR